jgi:hypothetical protein
MTLDIELKIEVYRASKPPRILSTAELMPLSESVRNSEPTCRDRQGSPGFDAPCHHQAKQYVHVLREDEMKMFGDR